MNADPKHSTDLLIRREVHTDRPRVITVIEKAFRHADHTDHREHHLVSRLQESDAFLAQLSLVAEIQGNIVGHILLTRISIVEGSISHDSLALAPVSVLPGFQGIGIGST